MFLLVVWFGPICNRSTRKDAHSLHKANDALREQRAAWYTRVSTSTLTLLPGYSVFPVCEAPKSPARKISDEKVGPCLCVLQSKFAFLRCPSVGVGDFPGVSWAIECAIGIGQTQHRYLHQQRQRSQ